MLYAYAAPVLAEALEFARARDRSRCLAKLRELPLGDFCQLTHEVGVGPYAELAHVLPRMVSEKDQNNWTGHSGFPLAMKSCGFARLLDILSYRCTGGGLSGKRILDYGCGWGRMMRVMYYYTDVDRVYGADPWDKSLQACAASGVASPTALCADLPKAAPFDDVTFDFIYSFSVFTHLSEIAARAVLRACRSAIMPNGVFVLTIRPFEFWDMRKSVLSEATHERLVRDHRQKGYAFTPSNWRGEKESTTFGDSSFSLAFMREMARDEGWEVAFFDRDLAEPYQLAVALRPS